MEKKRDRDEMFKAVAKSTGMTGCLEYRFHPTRRWRLDLAWPELRVGVEIQGGVFVGGKHARGDGIEGDHEKLNEAQLMGWIVLQFSPRQLDKPEALDAVLRAIRLQREQLADWMPEDTITLPADPARHAQAARAADENFHGDIPPEGPAGK